MSIEEAEKQIRELLGNACVNVEVCGLSEIDSVMVEWVDGSSVSSIRQWVIDHFPYVTTIQLYRDITAYLHLPTEEYEAATLRFFDQDIPSSNS